MDASHILRCVFLYNKKVEQYLHTAIAQDLFEVYYQPVYSTEKNDFVTLEALSRLHHPEGSPGHAAASAAGLC